MPEHDFAIHRPDPKTNSFTTDLRLIAATTDAGAEYILDTYGHDRGLFTPAPASIGLTADTAPPAPTWTGVTATRAEVDGRTYVKYDLAFAAPVTGTLHLGLPDTNIGGAVIRAGRAEQTAITVTDHGQALSITGEIGRAHV